MELSNIYSFIIGYSVIGAIVSLSHPKLLRLQLAELSRLDLGMMGLLLKPLMAIAVTLFYCVLWPIAWFNAGKSEKKAKEALDAQLERLRPFMMLHAAMNKPARYAGGDGSSFEQAVIILGATFISGPTAAYNFIDERYPGAQQNRQSLKEQDGKKYDVLEFTTAEGEHKTMYFHVSAHFPKPNDA